MSCSIHKYIAFIYVYVYTKMWVFNNSNNSEKDWQTNKHTNHQIKIKFIFEFPLHVLISQWTFPTIATTNATSAMTCVTNSQYWHARILCKYTPSSPTVHFLVLFLQGFQYFPENSKIFPSLLP